MDKIELNSIKAKKRGEDFQSLSEHTEWVVSEAMKLIDEVSLQKVSEKTGFEKEWIRELIFFSTYFHDIGKATVEFQEKIEGKKVEAFHSLYSFNLTYEIDRFDIESDYGIVNLLSLIVLTHHTIFKNSIFNSISKSFNILYSTKIFFYNYKNSYFKYFQKEPPNFEFPESFEYDLDEIKDGVEHCQNGEKLRILYSYILGILNLADWIASAKFDGKEFDFTQKVEYLDFSKYIPNFQQKKFQNEISELTSSAVVEIPTGEGKTEGSLLWALKNIRNKESKIIYTLPTQTTSNKLFERVKRYFGDVGLIHSSAKSYLENSYRDENGKVEWAVSYIFTKTFSESVTVGTLDSLLKHFINIGKYSVATFNYLNSVVIIDEVHSYDFKFLGFLKRFLEISDSFGVKVLLMSASIPNILKIKLGIENLPLITDKKLFEKKANIITKRDSLLEDALSDILENYRNGKKVLVIANTIQKATAIFKNLEVENKTLFHSQFKKVDRVKKEIEIFKKLDENIPYILVATQIVEISLDIDFEILFTEISPIDSLIQRFGRVNRKKNPDKIGNIYIFNSQNPKPYSEIPMKYAFEIVENGFFPISRYVEWLNLYYERLLDGDKSFQTEMLQNFEIGYRKYDEILKTAISEQKDYDLRDINILKEDFLLIEDFQNGNINFENTISLPSYFATKYLHSNVDRFSKRYWKTLNLKYDYESGVIFESDEDWNKIW